MAVSSFEVMSFLSKFLHLGTSGINATLQFDAAHGRVVANLTADLSDILPPPCPSGPNRSSPSRIRRRHRRAKAQSNAVVNQDKNFTRTDYKVVTDSNENDVNINESEHEPNVDY